MFTWVAPMMWAISRIVGNILTAIGVSGLAYIAGRALVGITYKVIEEDFDNED